MLFWIGIAFFVSIVSRPAQGDLFSHKEGVGVIEIKGMILSPEKILKELIDFQERDNVKAIVLRIDSPGGAVGASQEIYKEIKLVNKTKPVVASFGSVAASGGYYVALGAERIVSSPGTLTGSMGVIINFPNFEEIFKKIGYRTEVVKSGKMKDIGSSARPLSREERAVLQGIINNVHDQFVKAVAESRNLSDAEVRKLADGRIFSGEQAKSFGLIDQFGNFNDAAKLAAKLAQLEPGMPVLIYPPREDFSLFRFLGGSDSNALLNRLQLEKPILSYEWTMGR